MTTFLEVLEKATRSLTHLTEQAKTVRRLAGIGRLDIALDYVCRASGGYGRKARFVDQGAAVLHG